MTDAQISQLYQSANGVSHTAALRAVFDAGYAAHAGVTLGAGDPSKTASVPSSIPTVTLPKNDDHG